MSNIIGTGIDLIEVQRIANAIQRHGNRFLQKIFLPAEIAYAQSTARPAIHFAARFAAKEAAAKAFGTGISAQLNWLDLEVSRNPDTGQPSLLLHNNAQLLAQQLHISTTHLSLSHTHHHALAQCLLCK